MATLPNQDRAQLWADLMSQMSAVRESTGSLTKADVRDAINAVDDRISETEAGDNAALPQAVREQLTAKRKRQLDLAVRCKRLEVFHG